MVEPEGRRLSACKIESKKGGWGGGSIYDEEGLRRLLRLGKARGWGTWKVEEERCKKFAGRI